MIVFRSVRLSLTKFKRQSQAVTEVQQFPESSAKRLLAPGQSQASQLTTAPGAYHEPVPRHTKFKILNRFSILNRLLIASAASARPLTFICI